MTPPAAHGVLVMARLLGAVAIQSATAAASDAPAIVVGKRIFHVARRRSTDCFAEVAGDHQQRHVDTR
jgi:acyl dehydratase